MQQRGAILRMCLKDIDTLDHVTAPQQVGGDGTAGSIPGAARPSRAMRLLLSSETDGRCALVTSSMQERGMLLRVFHSTSEAVLAALRSPPHTVGDASAPSVSSDARRAEHPPPTHSPPSMPHHLWHTRAVSIGNDEAGDRQTLHRIEMEQRGAILRRSKTTTIGSKQYAQELVTGKASDELPPSVTPAPPVHVAEHAALRLERDESGKRLTLNHAEASGRGAILRIMRADEQTAVMKAAGIKGVDPPRVVTSEQHPSQQEETAVDGGSVRFHGPMLHRFEQRESDARAALLRICTRELAPIFRWRDAIPKTDGFNSQSAQVASHRVERQITKLCLLESDARAEIDRKATWATVELAQWRKHHRKLAATANVAAAEEGETANVSRAAAVAEQLQSRAVVMQRLVRQGFEADEASLRSAFQSLSLTWLSELRNRWQRGGFAEGASTFAEQPCPPSPEPFGRLSANVGSTGGPSISALRIAKELGVAASPSRRPTALTTEGPKKWSGDEQRNRLLAVEGEEAEARQRVAKTWLWRFVNLTGEANVELRAAWTQHLRQSASVAASSPPPAPRRTVQHGESGQPAASPRPIGLIIATGVVVRDEALRRSALVESWSAWLIAADEVLRGSRDPFEEPTLLVTRSAHTTTTGGGGGVTVTGSVDAPDLIRRMQRVMRGMTETGPPPSAAARPSYGLAASPRSQTLRQPSPEPNATRRDTSPGASQNATALSSGVERPELAERVVAERAWLDGWSTLMAQHRTAVAAHGGRSVHSQRVTQELLQHERSGRFTIENAFAALHGTMQRSHQLLKLSTVTQSRKKVQGDSGANSSQVSDLVPPSSNVLQFCRESLFKKEGSGPLSAVARRSSASGGGRGLIVLGEVTMRPAVDSRRRAVTAAADLSAGIKPVTSGGKGQRLELEEHVARQTLSLEWRQRHGQWLALYERLLSGGQAAAAGDRDAVVMSATRRRHGPPPPAPSRHKTLALNEGTPAPRPSVVPPIRSATADTPTAIEEEETLLRAMLKRSAAEDFEALVVRETVFRGGAALRPVKTSKAMLETRQLVRRVLRPTAARLSGSKPASHSSPVSAAPGNSRNDM